MLLTHCYLARAFNKCIDEGVFPDIFKTANVVPIFMRGEKKDHANYRPISQLRTLNKVFEKILQNRMLLFTEKNNLICLIQYKFRNNMSCVDAIAALTEFIRTKLYKTAQDQTCFIELQKAFDHDNFLNKLLDYGYSRKIFETLRDYFSDHWQYIRHNCVCTEKLKIVSCVTQGYVSFFCILITFNCV